MGRDPTPHRELPCLDLFHLEGRPGRLRVHEAAEPHLDVLRSLPEILDWPQLPLLPGSVQQEALSHPHQLGGEEGSGGLMAVRMG